MPASNAFQLALLELIFQNQAIANIGNSGGLQPSSAAGSLYIALHTADPGAGGSQTTNEAAYSGYARVAVARTSAAWPTSGSSPTEVSNAAAVNFPAATGGSETETYFSVGTVASGTGEILFKGALTSSLEVSAGITPQFPIGDLVVTLT